jgi:hypothetical protein
MHFIKLGKIHPYREEHIMPAKSFKGVEFEAFLHEAGANAFTLSPQRWIDTTNAIGVISRSGRGVGTFGTHIGAEIFRIMPMKRTC